MTIRLIDVAQACGVDRSTASRALRDDPVVNPETVARIKAAAARLGYRINQTARALRTGRTGNVLLITGSFHFEIEQQAARELSAQFERNGIDLYLAVHRMDDKIYRRLLEKAAQGLFDGVVIIPQARGLKDRFEETLYAAGLPIVFMDRYPLKSKIQVVTSANAAAASALAERLVQGGARRLLCCMADLNEVTHARRKGCQALARKKAIPCQVVSAVAEITLPSGAAPLGILGPDQHEVWSAMQLIRNRRPDLRLSGAVFDHWRGAIQPAAEVFVAVQDFAAMAREVVALITKSAPATSAAPREVPISQIIEMR